MKMDSTKASQNQRETNERSSKITRLAPTLTTIGQLKRAAADCKACDLWKRATQTVFGDGPTKAEVMFVGEQPGDHEDTAGHLLSGRQESFWIEP